MMHLKVKIKNIVLVALAILFLQPLIAQSAKQLKQDLTTDLVYLSSDYLEGRESGKKGARMAADYIALRFEEIGLQAKGTYDSWMHEFDFKFYPKKHSKEVAEDRAGRNVVAYLDNGAKNTVIIGGHYDHLGMGISGSRHTGEPAIHNGADDNASGIAALLNLAARLKKGTATHNNYLFIAFSAEELGLIGSKAYVEDPTIDMSKVNYMLNMDMVGRLNAEKVLAISGAGTSPEWKPILDKISLHGIKAKTTDSGIGPSDHTSFYLKNIPVLHFFTGQHTDYHKPEDDAHLINFKGVAQITNYMMALIEGLDDAGKIAFTKTKDQQKQGGRSKKYKVTLGVMPDYVHEGKGLKIDGVMDDRPAAKGGMEAGDVVIQIGETKVAYIYGYMDALGQFKKGDKTIVTFLRKGKEMKTEITF